MNYAKIRVGAKEFGYTPFNGMIYNLRLFFGRGYVPTMEQLKDVLSMIPRPDLPLPDPA